MVRQPTIKTPLDTASLTLSKLKKRTNRYTPAVTKVEEWTKADTGVGAAMAAGNQEEKGIWALFVNLAKAKMYMKCNQSVLSNKAVRLKLALPKYNLNEIPTIIITSPIRFLRAVNIPAFEDLLPW